MMSTRTLTRLWTLRRMRRRQGALRRVPGEVHVKGALADLVDASKKAPVVQKDGWLERLSLAFKDLSEGFWNRHGISTRLPQVAPNDDAHMRPKPETG